MYKEAEKDHEDMFQCLSSNIPAQEDKCELLGLMNMYSAKCYILLNNQNQFPYVINAFYNNKLTIHHYYIKINIYIYYSSENTVAMQHLLLVNSGVFFFFFIFTHTIQDTLTTFISVIFILYIILSGKCIRDVLNPKTSEK